MDELKKYLQENKDNLDTEEPTAGVWENVERRIAVSKPGISKIAFLKILAAACIIVLAGFGVYFLINNISTKNFSEQPASQDTVTTVSSNADDALLSITSLLENQKTVISSTPVFGVEQSHFEKLVLQYRNLENEEKLLRENLRDDSMTADNLDAMLQLLKNKLFILEQLKKEIDKVNNANKKKSSQKIYINIL